MNAIDLLHIAAQCQVTIELVDSEHIAVDPVDRLPDGILDWFRALKWDVIAYLSQQQRHGQPAANETPEAQCDHIDPLPTRHRRALNGFYYRLHQKQQTLAQRGYNVANAVVTVEEWRASVRLVLGLHFDEVEQVKCDLIQWGYLAYYSDLKNKLIEGNQQPLDVTQPAYSHDDYLPAGITGQDFRNWLYGSDSLQ